MPAPSIADRRLSSLLSSLVGRLVGTGGGIALVRLDDLDGADEIGMAALEGAGLVASAEPGKSVICDGCEQACPMEVIWPGGSRGPVIVCDKRKDIGRIPVDPARLQQWSVSLERLAKVMASLLDTDGQPEPMPEGKGWRLGTLRSQGAETPVRIVVADDGVAFWGLTVLLAPGSRAGASISLAELLLLRDGRLGLDRQALKLALRPRTDDPRVALEIQVVGREIVLLNLVTGKVRTLAQPDFNSVNDNVFQALFNAPGRTFTLDEIRSIAKTRTLESLGKVVEKLKFVGPLRKLFFEVSKSAIRFKRTVTIGELAALRLDPAKIF